jgi:hypothetical protein
MESLHKNQTWDLVELPERKRAIWCTWVFKKKEAILEKMGEKFKALLVAKGYSHRRRLTMRKYFPEWLGILDTSIRAVLALASHYDMGLEQIDVKTTFLHGDLEEQIYMEQP